MYLISTYDIDYDGLGICINLRHGIHFLDDRQRSRLTPLAQQPAATSRRQVPGP